MPSKRVMPDVFASAPRPPRAARPASKFNHYVPEPEQPPKAEAVMEEPSPSAPASVVSLMRDEARAEKSAPAKPAPPKMAKVAARPVAAHREDQWAVFEMPRVDVSVPVYDSVEALLAGPLVQAPLHVLPSMIETFQRIKANVRASGRKVSLQTLYAHGLAFAYLRSEEWLSLAPSDGRREGSKSRLTSTSTRITPELPVALIDATHALVARAIAVAPRSAPALESVKTAGLAWSLGRYTEWLEYAVDHPIKGGRGNV